MSYTEIYMFDKMGDANLAGQIQNAWRSAMAIWRIMEERHLPPYVPNYVKRCNWYKPNMTNQEIVEKIGYQPSRCAPTLGKDGKNPIQEIWDLADSIDVPKHERIVLFTTFGCCLLKKDNIPAVIEAFHQFGGETSLIEQADFLEQLLNDDDCIAVGWNQTSVNADTWGNKYYDEDTEESIPYNC